LKGQARLALCRELLFLLGEVVDEVVELVFDHSHRFLQVMP
jgi:hypothetical protein